VSVRIPARYTDEDMRDIPVELVVSESKRGKARIIRLQVVERGDWKFSVEVPLEASLVVGAVYDALTRSASKLP